MSEAPRHEEPAAPAPTFNYVDVYRTDRGSGVVDTPAFGRIVAGDYECETLEDSGRLVAAGEYDLVEDWHHPKDLKKRYRVPELRGVPGRSDCQIHIANRADQLDGCIAPGIINAERTLVESSGLMFEGLMKHIKYPCRIRIHDPL